MMVRYILQMLPECFFCLSLYMFLYKCWTESLFTSLQISDEPVLLTFTLRNRLVSFVLRTESIEDVLRLMSSMTAVLLLHYVCK